MAAGGRRPGAGRPSGKVNPVTRKALEKAAGGLMPLDYMLQVLRDPKQESQTRMDAAKAAAPYLHSKLSTATVQGPDGGAVKHEVTWLE